MPRIGIDISLAGPPVAAGEEAIGGPRFEGGGAGVDPYAAFGPLLLAAEDGSRLLDEQGVPLLAEWRPLYAEDGGLLLAEDGSLLLEEIT